MTQVPHSGNSCSGLCERPCDHAGCWQCEEYSDNHPELAMQKLKVTRDRALIKKEEDALRSALETVAAQRGQMEASLKKGPPLIPPPQRTLPLPRSSQMASITRGALEALAEKAGVRMSWNGGDPVFHDDDVNLREDLYTQAERKLMADKVKQLGDIVAKQNSKLISDQAARSLAKAAADSMDKMASDIIHQNVKEMLKSDIEANEKRVVDELKASGASDADIEAARRLMEPDPNKQNLFVQRLNSELQSISGLNDLLRGPKFKEHVARMKAQGIQPRAVLVHPSYFDESSDVDK